MEIREAVERAAKERKIRQSVAETLGLWLGEESLPKWARESLHWLIRRQAWDELSNRFYEPVKFGTAGLRGRSIGKIVTPQEVAESSNEPLHAAMGTACINEFSVAQATIGLYRHWENWLLNHCDRYDLPKLVVAYDMRYFSKAFGRMTAAIWESLGGHALLFDGPRSTPQLSFAVRHLRATAGVVITASHNPFHDNGFKAYGPDGAQVIDPHAADIAERVGKVSVGEVCQMLKTLEKFAPKYKILPQGVDEIYTRRLRDSAIDTSLFEGEKIRVIYTPLHGTGSVIMLPLLASLGIDLFTVAEQQIMDPAFSTVRSPNPENPSALEMALKTANEQRIPLVLATDPDADRLAVAHRLRDGSMEILSGNQVGILLAAYRLQALQKKRQIPLAGTPRATLIKSFVTSPLIEKMAERHRVKCINTLIGFKWIGAKLENYERQLESYLREEKGLAIDYRKLSETIRRKLLLKFSSYLILGVEESGGYMSLDITRDKDAHSAALMFCELFAWLRKQNKTIQDYLEEIYRDFGFYGEKLHTVTAEGADGIEKIRTFVKSLTAKPLEKIGDRRVLGRINFARDEVFDEDGERIPPADFHILDLEGSYRVAIRASGTEPKIKFYLFGCENGQHLARAQHDLADGFENLINGIDNELAKRIPPCDG